MLKNLKMAAPPKIFKNTIFNKDCIAGMKEIPDDTFDLIIADPPYNLNKDFGEWKES